MEAIGDLVAWDNLAVQHARTDFDPKERRALRRQQLVRDRLIAYRDTLREGPRHAADGRRA